MITDWEKTNGIIACDRCGHKRTAVIRKGMNLCVDCKEAVPKDQREQWRRTSATIGAKA